MVSYCGDSISGDFASTKKLRLAKTKTLFETKPPLQGGDGADGTARNQLPKVDVGLPFLTNSILENRIKATSNNSLYILRDESPEQDKSCFRKDRLLLVIAIVMESGTKALSIIQPGPPLFTIREIDESANVMIWSDTPTPFSSSGRNRSMLFSPAG